MPKRILEPQRVVMVGFDGAQILDVAGPLEVFSRAARWLVDNGVTDTNYYTVELFGISGDRIRCSNGIELITRGTYRDIELAHTVLISGGIGFRALMKDDEFHMWLQKQSHCAHRLGSICTGAFLLGAAGLLDEHEATTHWAYCDELTKIRPSIKVQPDAIYIRQGNIYTSAGVTAGMDMALAMVEEDWGQNMALAVAQELVLFLKRPGGQSQFSRHLAAQHGESDRLRELRIWMLENPSADLSVEALAARVAMSSRHFSRRFYAEMKVTPAKFVAQIRVEAARRKLEQTSLSLEKVAQKCGFENTENMRRSFMRMIGITPRQYRERFKGSAGDKS